MPACARLLIRDGKELCVFKKLKKFFFQKTAFVSLCETVDSMVVGP